MCTPRSHGFLLLSARGHGSAWELACAARPPFPARRRNRPDLIRQLLATFHGLGVPDRALCVPSCAGSHAAVHPAFASHALHCLPCSLHRPSSRLQTRSHAPLACFSRIMRRQTGIGNRKGTKYSGAIAKSRATPPLQPKIHTRASAAAARGMQASGSRDPFTTPGGSEPPSPARPGGSSKECSPMSVSESGTSGPKDSARLYDRRELYASAIDAGHRPDDAGPGCAKTAAKTARVLKLGASQGGWRCDDARRGGKDREEGVALARGVQRAATSALLLPPCLLHPSPLARQPPTPRPAHARTPWPLPRPEPSPSLGPSPPPRPPPQPRPTPSQLEHLKLSTVGGGSEPRRAEGGGSVPATPPPDIARAASELAAAIASPRTLEKKPRTRRPSRAPIISPTRVSCCERIYPCARRRSRASRLARQCMPAPCLVPTRYTLSSILRSL